MKKIFTICGLLFFGLLFSVSTQTQAENFTLVKTIDLYPMAGDDGSLEVDVTLMLD
jgi:hypothetical protein